MNDTGRTAESIYRKQGLGASSGWGSRPALVVVDFVNGFNDPDVLGGGNIPAAIDATVTLLAAARQARMPVAFSRIVYAPGADSVFCMKIPALASLHEDHPQSQIVPQLEVRPEDAIIRKTQPSAFFGTDLAGWLIRQGADTVLVAGCTTSGCVRATVVDAMSYNFRPVVVADCVGDRAPGPHEASLFDMSQKYGEVQTLADVLDRLVHLRA
ncbi:MAG: isochorismatase family protein [Pigmentiphaga sp.]|uniref:isochorismatase family protein n=1 Tax=Pigmentiphaga sp. TaxID=1977564 RepID=UPI0029A7F71F|nr:isochorismatase family protein [Pigmentiphaga sp.]MDX3906058.1 isochorismatase family protein [Pigmentiphaga sp.]